LKKVDKILILHHKKRNELHKSLEFYAMCKFSCGKFTFIHRFNFTVAIDSDEGKAMRKFQKLVALTLILTCTTLSIYGQDPYYQDYPENDVGAAYVQSSNTAHWSVYIPIAILVGAAIFFGLADRHHPYHDSSDSQDALGSIANPKRRSSSSYSSKSSYRQYTRYRSSSNSQGSYSHSS
jgi:hypothetical protein